MNVKTCMVIFSFGCAAALVSKLICRNVQEMFH